MAYTMYFIGRYVQECAVQKLRAMSHLITARVGTDQLLRQALGDISADSGADDEVSHGGEVLT